MIPKPLYDRLLVRDDPKKTTTEGGIVIPDSATMEDKRGVVLATGAGRIGTDGSIVPLTVRNGHHVMYVKHAGRPIKVDGEVLMLIQESDVLCILND